MVFACKQSICLLSIFLNFSYVQLGWNEELFHYVQEYDVEEPPNIDVTFTVDPKPYNWPLLGLSIAFTYASASKEGCNEVSSPYLAEMVDV